jgi:hypothetical protein
MQETNENIDRTIELSRHLLYCADFGDITCENRSCHTFYGTVRDRATQIINEAEQERQRYMTRDFSKTRKNRGTLYAGLRATSLLLWQSAKSIFKKGGSYVKQKNG